MERWRDAVPAILISWYSGMEGGHALADLLVGRVTPSGRLPCAFPADAADLPDFDRWAREVEYGRFHGQQHHDHTGRPPAYPLGWGLSYTQFEYGTPSVTENGDQIEVTVDVTNTGTCDAIDVVQCYAEAPKSKVERPQRWLVGFACVPVESGDTTSVRIDVPVRTLAHWDEKKADLVVEPTQYDLVVAPHAAADGMRTSIKIKKTRTV
jgi:beta-glucosidase